MAYEPETIREVYSGLLDILDERELKMQVEAARDTFLLLLVADPELIRGETVLRRILDRGQALNAAMILLAPNPQEVHEGFSARVTITNDKLAMLQWGVGKYDHCWHR